MTKAAKKPRGKADVVDGSFADVPAAVGKLPEPSEPRRRSIAHSEARMGGRRQRVSVVLPSEASNGALAIQSPHADQNGWAAQLNDAFGTNSADFAGKMLTTLANMATKRGTPVTETDLNAALAFVDGLEPQNEVEAALAVSMYGATDLAADLIARARQTDRIDFLNSYVNAATKLQRTAVAQAEAIAKLRRGGEQTVRVVYVDARTQTVIGEQHNHGELADTRAHEGDAVLGAVVARPAPPIDIGKAHIAPRADLPKARV